MPRLEQNILPNDGYVVYSSQWDGGLGKHAWWNRVRQKQEDKVLNLLAHLPSENNDYYFQIGENLIKLGEQERNKELALISKALDIQVDEKDEVELINRFNEVIIGVQNYKRALNQINLAVANYKNGQKQMAPVLSSLYLPKLQQRLGEAIVNFIHKYEEELMHGDLTDWENMWEQLLTKAIDQALEDLLQYTNKDKIKDIYGTDVVHTELLDEFRNNRDLFHTIIRNKINFEKVHDILIKNLEQVQIKLKSGKSLRGVKSWATAAVGGSKARAGQLGGSVNEFLNQLVQATGDSFKDYNRGAKTLISETLKTDNVLIFSLETKIDAEKIISGLDDALDKSVDLVESARIMNDYYEQHLKQLDNAFVVFTSGKAYGMSSFVNYGGGFQNDKHRSLEQLPDLLSQGPFAMSDQRAKDFLTVVVNAMPGAVLEDRRNTIETLLRTQLFQAMAYLLFDDWIALGNETGDTKAIHAFTLNNIEVPLSVLLMGAGEAIKKTVQYTRWFKVNVYYPDYVKYETRADYPQHENGSPNVEGAWEVQRVEAPGSISFSTHFLSNFYSEIISRLP